MLAYIVRRLLYAIPILIGVNLFTFFIFFSINTPDDMARAQLGPKADNPEAVEAWKRERGYHLPMLYNADAEGLGTVRQTIFGQKVLPLFWFEFGKTDAERQVIGLQIRDRMWPSLVLAAPTLLIGLIVNITFALILAFYRGTYLDFWGVVLCVVLMSVSILFYIIGGQWLFGITLKLFPISGYDPGLASIAFVILPIVVGVITGTGAGTRFQRTIFLEEINKDYVRTARAKGLREQAVIIRHALRNALIPVLTVIGPLAAVLVTGSFIVEELFAIPGVGRAFVTSVGERDYGVIMGITLFYTVVVIVANLAVDVLYAVVDPRIRYRTHG